MTASAERREKAIALLARGFTRADVARKIKVSERTVYRWQREAETAAAPGDTQPDEAAADEASDAVSDDLSADADVLALARQILAEQKGIARMARTDHNATAAARALKSAGDAAGLIARLEKDRKADADVVKFPRAEIERARQSMRERVAALAADLERTGGICCSRCGRELRIELARGDA